ncbi:toast rack family protein [Bacteroidota bacterium]
MKTILYGYLRLKLVILLFLTGFLFSLTFATNNRELDNEIVEKGKAEFIYTSIKFPAGELKIKGGTNKLLDADFTYSDPDWKPEIDYYEGERIGNLHITLDKVNISFDEDDRNVWNLVLNKEIAQDLNIKFGAGDADLDLAGFNLENFEFTTGAGDYYINLSNTSVPRVEFKAGAGEAVIDLSGRWQNNLSAEFNCGFGELTIMLPRSTGCRVKVNGILGDIDYHDLRKDGNEYTNDRFRETEHNLDIVINGGMGQINLRMIE